MTSEKAYDTAQRIDSQVAGGWSIPYEAVKSGSEGRSSTTLADDGDLILAVDPGQWYFDAHLFWHGGAGTSEGDFKFTFTIPAGTITWWTHYQAVPDGGVIHATVIQASGTTVSAWTNGASSEYGVSVKGQFNISASGNFTLRWAKGVSSDTNTTLMQWSRMSAHRRI